MNSHQQIISELQGFVELKMSRDALRLARLSLRKPDISPELFSKAVSAVLNLADDRPHWRALVESAFQRLPKASRPQVRFLMLAYYCALSDYIAAQEWIPGPFSGNGGLLALPFALEASVELKQMVKAKSLAKKCLHPAQVTTCVDLQRILVRSLAIYFTATREWDTALRIWGTLLSDDGTNQEAAFESIFIRTTQAAEAVDRAISLDSKLKMQTRTRKKLALFRSLLYRALPTRYKPGRVTAAQSAARHLQHQGRP
jgi:hypothetical protein